MNEIKFIKMTSDISLEKINYVIEKAFSNAANVRFASTGFNSELFEKLTKENELTCFAAMDGDKAVGTITYTTVDWNRWYYKGKAPKVRYVAVLPEYQGRHIATKLIDEVEKHAELNGYDTLFLSTPSKNTTAINMYKKRGFKLLLYKFVKDHDVVEMGYWKNGCPYSAIHIKSRYLYSKLKTFIRVKLLGR